MTPDIYYIHQGPVPGYLRCTIENTRAFNPGARLCLITDQPVGSQAFLRHMKVDVILIQDLQSEQERSFQQRYRHTSGNPEAFERFCFARWFYLHEAVRRQQSAAALHLDSDCMLFEEAGLLAQRLLPDQHDCYIGKGRVPHLALFTPQSLEGLTHSLEGIFDTAFFRDWEKSSWLQERRYFCDIAGLSHYTATTQHQVHMPILWPDAMIEQTMSAASGFECWPGPKTLKRVHWRSHGHLLQPSLRKQQDQTLIRALALHYKGAAKRRMRPFNRPGEPPLLRRLRCHWLNTVPPLNWFRWHRRPAHS